MRAPRPQRKPKAIPGLLGLQPIIRAVFPGLDEELPASDWRQQAHCASLMKRGYDALHLTRPITYRDLQRFHAQNMEKFDRCPALERAVWRDYGGPAAEKLRNSSSKAQKKLASSGAIALPAGDFGL